MGSDIREENRRLVDTERSRHKEEVQKIKTKLRSERDAFEVRLSNTHKDVEEKQNIIKEVKELIASTEIEGSQKATLLKHLKSQLEKTKNEVASEQFGILEASVSKEEEKKVLRRQVSNLIDQINELRQQRDDQKSIHSLTSLSSTFKDKETEINRLMEDNINYIEASNNLMETLQKVGKAREQTSLNINGEKRIMDLEMTPEEIKAQLVCLQDENTKLRQYIDRVLTAIME